MKRLICLLITGILWTGGLSQPVAAATFDHSLFDQVLKKYVNDKGLVDYNGIARDTTFKEYIDSLATAKVDTMSLDAQLAFWINAYNAITIDKVIKWRPQKSVRETLIPGLWTSTKFYSSREHTVAGKRVSPDDIENNILRQQFKDPRIHFAIICASSGCPLLPRIAYTEENVQARLEEETRAYLNSSRGTIVNEAENTLYISKIFEWFAGDFVSKASSVPEFIKPYLSSRTLAFLEKDPKISYLDYDWALNAQGPLQ